MRRAYGFVPSLVIAACVSACDGGSVRDTNDASFADAALDAPIDANDAGIDSWVEPPTFDASFDAEPQVPAYDVHLSDRGGCSFGPGDTTTTTIGPDVPHGDALPFKHIVVVMMENRSFDEYFSQLPAHGVPDVDVAPGDATNAETDGGARIGRFHETRYCVADPDHDWDPTHAAYDDGKMDGFVAQSEPDGERVMGYYDDTDLPFYYWLAKTFALTDRHFSSTLGPTWPNRYFFWGATAWGKTQTNFSGTNGIAPANVTKITDVLTSAGHTYGYYSDDVLPFGYLFSPTVPAQSIAAFVAALDDDALPDLAIVDPNFLPPNEDDEHPPSNIQSGQLFVANIFSALANSPSWQDTVLFYTYDEHGGFYDHAPPPAACIPDDIAPPDYAYDRLGIRVPFIAISAYARANYVSHVVSDHTSITRFIENRFDLPAMTKRDANAWPLLDMFDFDAPPFMTPPAGAPIAVISDAGAASCVATDAGTRSP